MISIIIPVYNSSKTLRQCVDSILRQENNDLEIILVDDGSSDGSGAICDSYVNQDKRIRAFHKKNGGVSSARNLGLDNANGEWICFIDSDDYVSDNYLTINQNYDCDIIFLGAAAVYSATNISLYKELDVTSINDSDEFFCNNFKNRILKTPWGKIIRRKFIDELRFLEVLMLGEDLCFNLSLFAKKPKIDCNSKAIYYYNAVDLQQSISKYTMPPKVSASHVEVLFDTYMKTGINSKELEIHLIRCFFDCCDKSNFSSLKEDWFNNKCIKNLERKIKDIFNPFYYNIHKHVSHRYALPLIWIDQKANRLIEILRSLRKRIQKYSI